MANETNRAQEEALGKAQSDNDTPAEKVRRETAKPETDGRSSDKPGPTEKSTPVVKSAKHYRCESFSQLSIAVDGEVKARFSPFLEKFQGDSVKVGYLETDDKEVIERLSNDTNVEEISASDYEKATGPKSFRLPQAA